MALQRKRRSDAEPVGVPKAVNNVLRSSSRPLDLATRAYMEPRFGHEFGQMRVHRNSSIQPSAVTIGDSEDRHERDADRMAGTVLANLRDPNVGPGGRYEFGNVRVHTNADATQSAADLNAQAYTLGSHIVFGSGQYAPSTTKGKRLLAHELTHVVQQAESRTRTGVIQRDLALEPTVEVSQPPELTAEKVSAAIRYNRASYDQESTELIQDLVGVEQTGQFDEATVRAVAYLQAQFGLKVDGKVGPDTYDLLIRELQAEKAAPGTCLTLFQIEGPEPLRFFRTTPSAGTIGSRFFIHIRFDPRCDCEDWEYRQYIAGHVELRDVAGPVFDLDSMFAIPGGGLPATLQEDGDTAIPAGTAGHHYGHRRAASNPSDNRDRYLPDRRTGCAYEGHDFPELGPLPASPGDAGDVYDWVMRFRGVVRRRDHGVVQEKYWAIRGVITIP